MLSFEGARRVAVCASNRIVFVVEHDKTLASALVRGGSDELVCSPLRPSTHRTRLVYSPAHERARGALALRGLRSSRLRVAWDASRPWSHRSSSPCSIFTTGLWVGLPWPSPATARPVAGPRRLTRTSPRVARGDNRPFSPYGPPTALHAPGVSVLLYPRVWGRVACCALCCMCAGACAVALVVGAR